MTQNRTEASPLLDATEYRKTLSELLVSLFGDTGMRLTVCDLNGKSVGAAFERGEFCDYVYHSSLKRECRSCTMLGIQTVQKTHRPYHYRCHMGLASTMLPILQNGVLIGCLLFSGYRMEPDAMEKLDALLSDQDLATDYPELYAKFDLNPFFPQERIREFTRLLFVTVEHLTKVNENTQTLIALQGKSLELLANANIREQQEKKKTRTAYKILENRVQDQFLFDAMGHISALASLAHNTELAELLQDLAVAGQKSRHPDAVVVLGQDIEDLNRYFHLMRSMYDGRVCFQMEIDPSCDRSRMLMQLPFATLIDILLREMLAQNEPKEVCTLTVFLAELNHELELRVSIDAGVMAQSLVHHFNQLRFPAGDLEGLLFQELIEEQRLYYGPNVRWKCTCKTGISTSLSLYLPLREEGTL